ncbi:uncharacterized protein LOC129570572 [Sitodiplosis mosellana]|uniref:uncharacterized protein LOC129570572 n=1 Tax=Sitodiplosis mosellana TaxID=263140 RepID=UPI0024446048|nr:uncharacterized protein LOC129570572 [Sitodiplosis mosellana]
MFRLQVAFLFAVALTFSAVKCSNEVVDSNESPIVENLDGLIAVPGVINELLRHFLNESLTEYGSSRLLIKHTAGNRVNGDRLLIHYKSPRKESRTAFNVRQTEMFAFEAIITYIEIVVEQSNNESRINGPSGGVGYRHVVLETLGNKTLYFSYTTEIYGYY